MKLKIMLVSGIAGWLLLSNHQAISNFLLTPSTLSFLLPVNSSPAEADIQSIILQQVKSSGELTTVEMNIQLVIPVEQKGSILWIIPDEKSLLFVAEGKVKAGVDLNAIQKESLQITDDGQVILVLPPARIQDVYLDEAGSKTYSYQGGVMGTNQEALKLQDLARSEAIQNLKAEACHSGILTQANERARDVLEKLLNQVTQEKIVIQSQEGLEEEKQGCI